MTNADLINIIKVTANNNICPICRIYDADGFNNVGSNYIIESSRP